MVAAVSSDLDGDGKMTREDEFGMLREDFSSNGNILYFLVGCGVRATTNDKDGIPQISFYNDKTQTIIDKVSVVFKDENCTIEYNNCASGAIFPNSITLGILPVLLRRRPLPVRSERLLRNHPIQRYGR